ncbi:MAG: hypothetical protein QOE79_1651 [Sphingomonadales bacterium]|jgi:D-arabinono-1,4-lactone oxidase|nr:hypothetical protein [Sphingomonadales bacterium]
MNLSSIIAKEKDGYYHPKNEDEVVALVKYAAANKLQIRVRGASHSTAHSIFTDPVDELPVNMTLTRTPPTGANLNLAMDRMIALEWIDEASGIAEAEAGIHLGLDPYDPIGTSTLENSLLYQLSQKGWGINDLGGITHQTVSGFTAAGSSGGSLIYDLDNVIAFRVVDGTGNALWIEETDPAFQAMCVSVGLLGIVTKVRLRCNRAFTISGQENTTPTTGPVCPIDLFGAGEAGKPSLRQFLEQTPYSRIMWWPQKGADRVVIWQADRHDEPPPLGYKPIPYQEFTTDLIGWLKQLVGSIFFVLLGNSKPDDIKSKLSTNFARFNECVAQVPLPVPAAWVTEIVQAILDPFIQFFTENPCALQELFPTALDLLQPMSKGKPTLFNDYYWSSLPMDNTADDVLLGTEFTEIWIPIQYTEQCMNLLKGLFDAPDSPAVGYYSTEIYGTKKNGHWLSPAYSDGQDEYKDGVVRFDVFWFRGNEGAPNVRGGFYQQYWDLFRANNIPFRFHWGKFIPAYDFADWAAFYRQAWPKMDDFLKLRQERDPEGVFFTRYWRQRLLGEA